MQNAQDRLLRYIDDAHAAEIGIGGTLQGYLDEAKDDQACRLYEDLLLQTKDQALRLERRLRALGGQPSGPKGLFNGLLAKLGDLVQGAHDDYDKATQNLIKTYATAHLGVAMYAALAAYSRAYGDDDTATLAEDVMAEEQRAADMVRPLIAGAAAGTYTAAAQKAA